MDMDEELNEALRRDDNKIHAKERITTRMETKEEKYRRILKEKTIIPEHMQKLLALYLAEGYLTDRFLESVLKNDLRTACITADENNLTILYEYIRFLWNYAPSDSWGSKEVVDRWTDSKREGRQRNRI